MASQPSQFEQMVTNNGPIQTSIIGNLSRWESTNLLLAGVRIPVSQKLLRKHQIPTRCSERVPQSRARCPNSTESFDEIRACTGHPFGILQEKKFLKQPLGAQETRPCLQVKWWRYQENDLDIGTEPNTGKYPIHTKVCRRCRDFYATELWDEQLLMIAQFRAPLCKWHSLEQSNQLPHNACRCFAYINDKWRCQSCYVIAMFYLKNRADLYRESKLNAGIAWSQPLAYLRRLWGSGGLVCPIKGCIQQPWHDITQERMQLCMGCCSICKI